MRTSSVIYCLLILLGCGTASAQLLENLPERCYSSTDGLRYNSFALRLKSDGSYEFALNGDVGRWGISSGKWEERAEVVVLHETSNDGHVRFPSVLPLLGDGSLKLVYDGPYYSSKGGTNLSPWKCVR